MKCVHVTWSHLTYSNRKERKKMHRPKVFALHWNVSLVSIVQNFHERVFLLVIHTVHTKSLSVSLSIGCHHVAKTSNLIFILELNSIETEHPDSIVLPTTSTPSISSLPLYLSPLFLRLDQWHPNFMWNKTFRLIPLEKANAIQLCTNRKKKIIEKNAQTQPTTIQLQMANSVAWPHET